ncbi:hypothetical protein I5L56_10450 [Pseudomonas oryzihabitans]|uniref:hypothetical protein n=1 Tax=Pseudomonas oryzihabitans TaxID=47885 RepID=UPI0018D8D6C3|nr:hypothetical protein [Pseudomonas oryzihabitans]MBH3330043.1 hypothetical protein [Pseudomonas oryzihabitans]
MKPRICLLLNDLAEAPAATLLERLLPSSRVVVDLAVHYPAEPERYTAIVPFNYRRLLPAETLDRVLVFHASALPQGRGWAPIYYSIVENQPCYVVTGFRAAAAADTGDLIVQASFPLRPEYTAAYLRQVDEPLFLQVLGRLLERWPTGDFPAIPQSGEGTFRERRRPADNEIDPTRPFADWIPHLRAVEAAHPAFFFYRGVKYLVEVRPEIPPAFPPPLRLEYCASGEIEWLEDWV